MRRDDSIAFFKRKAYRCLTIYKKIETLKRQIEELDYRIAGVTGIDLTATHGSSTQSDKDYQKLKLMDRKDVLERRLKACNEYINWLYEVVEDCSKEYRPYIVETYMLRKRVDSTAMEAEIPVSVLSRKMGAELKSALSEERIRRMEDIIDRIEK